MQTFVRRNADLRLSFLSCTFDLSSMLCFYKTAIEARTPYRGSRGACGIDLPIPHSVTLEGHQKVSVDLFLQVGLPPGHFGLLKLRSGAARRHKLLLHGGVIGENSTQSCTNPV